MKRRIKYLFNLVEQYGIHNGYIWRNIMMTALQAGNKNKDRAIMNITRWELDPSEEKIYMQNNFR